MGGVDKGAEDGEVSEEEIASCEETARVTPDAGELSEGAAIALFDHEPQDNDELAFHKGSELQILEIQDDGWCVARNSDGATGLVPGNYVKMVQAQKHQEPASPSLSGCDAEQQEKNAQHIADDDKEPPPQLRSAVSTTSTQSDDDDTAAADHHHHHDHAPEPPQHRSKGGNSSSHPGGVEGRTASAAGRADHAHDDADEAKHNQPVRSEIVQVITEAMANQLVLNRGTILTQFKAKSFRRVAARRRQIWVSGDHRILWQDPDNRKKKPKSVRMSEISEITNTVTHGDGAEGCCFTLVTPAKSFEFQAQDQAERDFWVKQLRLQVEEALQAERERKVIERSYLRDISVPERHRQWVQEVLPGFAQMRMTKQCRDLCWLGVPTNLRREVWTRCIGNQLQITKDLFQIFREHASKARQEMERKRAAALKEDATEEEKLAWKGESHLLGSEASLKVIDKDLPRTFTKLAFFHNGGPLEQQLRDVLEAYVFYRPDVGYVQGMSYIASMFLLNMDTCQSFIALANLFHSHYFLSFFAMDMTQIQIRFAVFEFFFEHQLPKLYKHFKELGVTTDTYLLNWLMTLFAKSLPLDVTTRVWDNYLLVGESFMIRTALGVLQWRSSRFLDMDFEDIMVELSQIHQVYIDEDELFESIRMVSVTGPHFDKVLQAQMAAQGLAGGAAAAEGDDWHAHALDHW